MQKISRQALSRYPRKLQGGARVLGRAGAAGRPKTLSEQYQAALDKANAANEARYKGILTGYDDLSKRVSGELANAGAMEQKDITRQYKGMGADVYQRLVNRGFGNSSLTGTMQMGVERERTDAMARAAERAALMRANADMQLSQGRFGVMERRTDLGPDPDQMIRLSQGIGRTQAGNWQMGPDGRMYGQPIGMNYGQQQPVNMGGMIPWARQGRSDAAKDRYAESRYRRSLKRANQLAAKTAKAPFIGPKLPFRMPPSLETRSRYRQLPLPVQDPRYIA